MLTSAPTSSCGALRHNKSQTTNNREELLTKSETGKAEPAFRFLTCMPNNKNKKKGTSGPPSHSEASSCADEIEGGPPPADGPAPAAASRPEIITSPGPDDVLMGRGAVSLSSVKDYTLYYLVNFLKHWDPDYVHVIAIR